MITLQAHSQGSFLGVTSNNPLKLMIFIAGSFASLKDTTNMINLNITKEMWLLSSCG